MVSFLESKLFQEYNHVKFCFVTFPKQEEISKNDAGQDDLSAKYIINLI